MAQFNVNLAFNADTGRAKAQIQELQSLLNKIAYTGATGSTNGLQTNIQAAAAAAKELQFHLNNAFNTSTGNFDLSLLDRSLKTSGSNIQTLSTQLLNAGATGQQAFMKLAQSISLADQPMLRISKRMQDFATTMKNTIKWQLSSSMLHGFMGAVQSAYGYAKDLNKSLNDIRIVTGYNTDKMAQFAEQANKAAKALSTTTTDYTNASLIYFQQGLNDAEVAARTDITVKMANAVGQSAEVISEQLTAVWNNFDDGSKSLEYYADVMTALGAATASSSDEISEGLSKFAAVASSVGLSYEYATAALATLTSNTRESADVVGNALKTLFARIQGLKLGETLDDGTDLNKYSQALEKVGISVYDTNGGLKDMDNILDEMAEKWTTLSDTQKVALAQTVAGVRQYNQLIALMENWNNGDSDSMIANLRTAEGSEGALQEQADIYAESWEAAEKRVKAAAEGIFQSLLKDEFFIDLTNGFATALRGIDAFIDGAGGVKTVLTGIASIIISTFAHKIPQALDTLRYNLEFATKGSQAAYDRIQSDMAKATQTAFDKYQTTTGKQGIKEDSSMGYAIKQANELTAARNKLALVSGKMSASEIQMANTELSLIEATQQEVIGLKQKNEELQKSISLQKDAMRKNQSTALQSSMDADFKSSDSTYGDARKKYNSLLTEYTDQFNQLDQKIDGVTYRDLEKIGMFDDLRNQYSALIEENDTFNEHYQGMIKEIQSSTQTVGQNILEGWLNPSRARDQVIHFKTDTYEALSSIQSLMGRTDISDQLSFDLAIQEIKALSGRIPSAVQEASGLDKVFSEIINKSANLKELKTNFKTLEPALRNCKIEVKDFEKFLTKLHGKSIEKLATDVKTLTTNEAKAAEQAKNLQKLYDNFNPRHVVRMSEAFGSLAGMLGNVSMLMNSISSLSNALSPDVDMTAWERVSAVVMGLSMSIPSTIALLKSFGTVVNWVRTVNTANTAAIHAETIAQNTNNLAKQLATVHSGRLTNLLSTEQIKRVANIIATEKEAGSTGKATAAKIVEYLTTNKIVGSKTAEFIARLAVKHGTDLETASTWKLIGALLKEVALWAIKHWYIMLIVAAVGLLIAGIVSLVKSYESEAEALERVNKELEKTKSNYDDAKNAVKAFEEAFNDYSEGLKALDEMTAGSKELSEALEENNKKARQLIEAYELFDKGDYSYGADGRIIINTESENYKAIQSRLAQGESLAAAAYYNKLIQQQQKENNKMLSEYARTIKFKQYMQIDEHEGRIKYLTGDEYSPDGVGHQAVTSYLRGNDLKRLSEAIDVVEEKFGYIPATAEELVESIQKLVNKTNELDGILAADGPMYARLSDIISNEYLTTILDVNSALGNSVDALNYFNNQLLGSYTDDNYYDEAMAATNNDETAAQAMLQLKNLLIANGQDNISRWVEQENERYQFNKQGKSFDGFKAGGAESFISDQIAYYFGQDSNGNPVADFNTAQWLSENYGQIFSGTSITQGQNLDVLDMAKAVYSAKGYTDVVVTEGEGDNVVVSYTSGNQRVTGEQMSFEDTQERWMESIWNYIVGQKIDTMTQNNLSEEDFQAIATNIYQKSNSLYGADWSSAIAMGIAQGNQFDFSSIFGQLDAGEIDEITEMAKQRPMDLAKRFGLDPWTMEQAGLGTAKEFADGVLAGLEGWSAEDNANAINSEFEKLAESLDINTEDFIKYREALIATNRELAKNPKLLNTMTLSYMQMQKGIKKMSDSFDDWTKAIKNRDKDIIGYAKAMNEVKESYKEVFSAIDPELIDSLGNEFLSSANAMDLMQRAISGDTKAWDDWETAVLQQINNTSPAFANMSEDMKTKMDELTAMAAHLDFSGLIPGADINIDNFVGKLQQLKFSTREAAQIMSNNLSSVGVDAKIVEYKRDDPGYRRTVRQSGGLWVHPPMGEPEWISLDSTWEEVKDPSTDTFYTLEGATYNGRGVQPAAQSNSGGGGGGSAKHPEKKSSGDRTRYHTIQNQLEDVSSSYDNISNAAERAFGKDKLDLMNEQGKALDNLIDKQKEYVDALSEDVPLDKAVMEAYYDEVIGGVAMQFDELGNIANYDDIEAAMHAKYNEMADQHTDDSEEWQAFEKQYEQMEKYIEDYEQYYDDLRDAEAEYQDLLNQRIDLELEKVQYKVELELEIPENEIAILEYQLGQIEDDAFKSAEAINLLTKQAEATYDQIQANKQGLNDALKLSLSMAEITQLLAGDTSVLNNQSFTSDQIDAIKEYRDNLLDLNEEFNDIRNSIEEKVMETFDAWHEKLESGIGVLDHYNSVLESYKNIVDIVGGDTLGLSDQFMADLSQASVDNAIGKVNATRDVYETMISAQKEAEVALEEARARGDEASVHMWEENLNTLTEEAQAAHEEMLSAWEEALSGIADQFEITVERVIKSFNDSIYALGGLDGLQDDFSRQQENADRMLDDYQKIYELSKLSRDINKTIDDTDNLAGKQKLKKLLGEINKLQEDGVEMSQYDLEYLQKTYDLRLAEIELEEAQRAKNTVRLSKDNEGNWSYIYTQNTDAVDAAQQKYEDALYAMQDLSSNYIDEMSEQLIATSQEMAEALAAIRIQDFASIDDYYAEVERVQAQYQDQLSMQQDELQKAIDNNKILYDEDWTNYHNATGYKISDTENFATVFKDTLLGTLIGSEEDAANFTDIIGSAVSDLTTNLMAGAEVYYQNLEAAMNAAGTSTGNFAEDTATNIDAVVEKSKEGAAAVDQMAQEMEEAFNHITDTIVNWQETYGSAMQEIINSNMAVIESFNEMLKALSIDADSITVKYDIANAAGAKAEQFDTGGYTGDWGSGGRLAVVHEKELILNPGDTANFLSAIQITRTMLETIDLNARQASFGLGNLVPTTIKDDNKQTLEQEVHITAEFPNVSDHNEIEEAFNNLINTASQYANRK